MLLAAARDLSFDLERSAMFGDKASDIDAAAAAGVPQRVLLGTDGRAPPREDLAPLATARFASLADAVTSASLRATLIGDVDA
jgi:D-glycero-D-manno-heptose 1,7-bisphosphate phosphatase